MNSTASLALACPVIFYRTFGAALTAILLTNYATTLVAADTGNPTKGVEAQLPPEPELEILEVKASSIRIHPDGLLAVSHPLARPFSTAPLGALDYENDIGEPQLLPASGPGSSPFKFASVQFCESGDLLLTASESIQLGGGTLTTSEVTLQDFGYLSPLGIDAEVSGQDYRSGSVQPQFGMWGASALEGR